MGVQGPDLWREEGVWVNKECCVLSQCEVGSDSDEDAVETQIKGQHVSSSVKSVSGLSDKDALTLHREPTVQHAGIPG